MKALRCRDLGERTCNYVAFGDRYEEVGRKMFDHTANKHHMFLESLDYNEREHFLEQMEAMTEDEEVT
ncbi:MAG: DUF1059 domain-containing protein [Fibrobacter sp.]|jgi:predicted small metal-binding protein|nr:DUF1059 domain-containing protein [Fibrobacter sp.]HON10926.1 DUF1059 domain-containing protein [Chitinispirillaceae bacterium]